MILRFQQDSTSTTDLLTEFFITCPSRNSAAVWKGEPNLKYLMWLGCTFIGNEYSFECSVWHIWSSSWSWCLGYWEHFAFLQRAAGTNTFKERRNECGDWRETPFKGLWNHSRSAGIMRSWQNGDLHSTCLPPQILLSTHNHSLQLQSTHFQHLPWLLKFLFQYVALAVAYLALKTEETNITEEELIPVFCRFLKRAYASEGDLGWVLGRTGEYDLWWDWLVCLEMDVLIAFGFKLHVARPHKLMFTYLQKLELTDVMQEAWVVLNDW